MNNIDADSEQAKVLQKYVSAGIVSNYKEALTHVAVRAELAQLDAEKTARDVIDETDEAALKRTKTDIVGKYVSSGEVPTDKKLVAELASENLKRMGL